MSARLRQYIYKPLRARLKPLLLRWYDLLLVSQGNGWVLDDYSLSLLKRLNPAARGRMTDVVPYGLHGKTVHFVDRYPAFRPGVLQRLGPSNRLVLTWWHGGASDIRPIHITQMLDNFHLPLEAGATFHITSSLYHEVLRAHGVPSEHIRHLPMGVEPSRFTRGKRPRVTFKSDLGLPAGRVCIGTFQRDGEVEPKLVKGPDILVKVIERLHKAKARVVVLLAGPKRGYLVGQLERIGVPYMYVGWVPYKQMARYYFACDLYIISSREEGGPAAVLECMATGTPLVSTRVGMAVDVIEHGVNGFLADVEDDAALAEYSLRLAESEELRQKIGAAALETAPRYDWDRVAPEYARTFYGLQAEPFAGPVVTR